MRTLVLETVYKEHTIKIWGDEYLFYDYELIDPKNKTLLGKDENYTSVEDALDDAKRDFENLTNKQG